MGDDSVLQLSTTTTPELCFSLSAKEPQKTIFSACKLASHNGQVSSSRLCVPGKPEGRKKLRRFCGTWNGSPRSCAWSSSSSCMKNSPATLLLLSIDSELSLHHEPDCLSTRYLQFRNSQLPHIIESHHTHRLFKVLLVRRASCVESQILSLHMD